MSGQFGISTFNKMISFFSVTEWLGDRLKTKWLCWIVLVKILVCYKKAVRLVLLVFFSIKKCAILK